MEIKNNENNKLMIENKRLLKFLNNPTKNLKWKMPKIMQAFIEFYGLDKSEHIKEKFSNMIAVCDIKPNTYKTIVQEIEKNFNTIIENLFLEEIEQITDNDIENFKKRNSYFSSYLDDFFSYFSDRNIELRKYAIIFLKHIGYNDISESNIEDILNNNILFDVEKYYQAYQKYQVRKEKMKAYLQPYLQKVNQLDELEQKITFEYGVMFYNGYEDLTEKELELQEKMLAEYYEHIEDFTEHREQIKNLNLVSKDTGYTYKRIEGEETCCVPNAIIKNNEVIPFPIVNINLQPMSNSMDETIIHELNHMYELVFKNESETKFIFVSGYDTVTCSKEVKMDEEYIDYSKKRDTEIFNEAINDYIAHKITEILHKNGYYIFENTYTAINTSAYEYLMPFISRFFEENKMEILKSRENGEIIQLSNYIGQENLNKFIELLNNYSNYCKGLLMPMISVNNYIRGIKDDENLKMTEYFIKMHSICDDIQSYKTRKLDKGIDR